MMARRFAPSMCALLEYGVRFDWRDGGWLAHTDARRLGEDGAVEEVAR